MKIRLALCPTATAEGYLNATWGRYLGGNWLLYSKVEVFNDGYPGIGIKAAHKALELGIERSRSVSNPNTTIRSLFFGVKTAFDGYYPKYGPRAEWDMIFPRPTTGTHVSFIVSLGQQKLSDTEISDATPAEGGYTISPEMDAAIDRILEKYPPRAGLPEQTVAEVREYRRLMLRNAVSTGVVVPKGGADIYRRITKSLEIIAEAVTSIRLEEKILDLRGIILRGEMPLTRMAGIWDGDIEGVLEGYNEAQQGEIRILVDYLKDISSLFVSVFAWYGATSLLSGNAIAGLQLAMQGVILKFSIDQLRSFADGEPNGWAPYIGLLLEEGFTGARTMAGRGFASGELFAGLKQISTAGNTLTGSNVNPLDLAAAGLGMIAATGRLMAGGVLWAATRAGSTLTRDAKLFYGVTIPRYCNWALCLVATIRVARVWTYGVQAP